MELGIRGASGDHAAHFKEYEKAPQKRHAGTERDERIHIRRAVKKRLNAAFEELPVDVHHDQSQDHLRECQAQVVVIEVRRKRKIPHVVSHRHIHQDQ